MAAFALLLWSGGANASGTPGKFDYWLLALSWSPQYCASARHDESQCHRDPPLGFVVHGLWPQYEFGFPSDCVRKPPVPDATVIAGLVGIMPSPALILHEWVKHGTCSGLDVTAYANEIEADYRRIQIPEKLQPLDAPLHLRATELEADLIAANPTLTPASVVLLCRGTYLTEVDICLDLDKQPRACSFDVHDHCGKHLTLRPMGSGQ